VGKYNPIRRTSEPKADRGPILCATPDCTHYGTMSESTTHEDARDVRWYCRDHWDLRGDPQKAHQLALEMRRSGARRDLRHWADIEVAERVLDMPDDDHKTARQFLDDLLRALGRRT
jgi:hypothetical protein